MSYDETGREEKSYIDGRYFWRLPSELNMSAFLQEALRPEQARGLRCLKILQQAVPSLRGIQSCPALEELWVVNCQVSKLESFGASSALKKLQLYGNQISRLENLDTLTNLQVGQ